MARDMKELTGVAFKELNMQGRVSETGQSIFNQAKTDYDIKQSTYRLLRDEYETWELLRELNAADRTHFNSNSGAENCCPRTLSVVEVIRDHSNLTVHAVADWLEKIFTTAEAVPDTLP
jgi:hypothetical protein